MCFHSTDNTHEHIHLLYPKRLLIHHPDLTLWSLLFMLKLLSQPIRTADAGLPGISASEQRLTQLLSTSLLHWLPRLRTINTNSNSKDNKSASKTKTSNASLLTARDLCNIAHTAHTCTNQGVNKWYSAPPPPLSHPEQGAFVFAILGNMPSIQILWSMPPLANLGVPALLAVQLLLKPGGMPSQTTPHSKM